MLRISSRVQGGCIALHHEVYGDYRQELLPDLAHRVGGIMDRVICRSQSQQIPTYLAAESIAEERMKSVRQLKPIYRRNNGSK
jgi:hypothetical protein